MVAFEIIEHVQDQERVLDEVARLLGDVGAGHPASPPQIAGSTARRPVGTTPFSHRARELRAERSLQELLAVHFTQECRRVGPANDGRFRIYTLSTVPGGRGTTNQPDFYIERAGEEWREAGDPAGLLIVALASKAPLPEMADTSDARRLRHRVGANKELDTAHVVRRT